MGNSQVKGVVSSCVKAALRESGFGAPDQQCQSFIKYMGAVFNLMTHDNESCQAVCKSVQKRDVMKLMGSYSDILNAIDFYKMATILTGAIILLLVGLNIYTHASNVMENRRQVARRAARRQALQQQGHMLNPSHQL